MPVNVLEEAARPPADGPVDPLIGSAKPAGHHAAEKLFRHDEDHRVTMLSRLAHRGDAGRRAAVDDDVRSEFIRCSERRSRKIEMATDEKIFVHKRASSSSRSAASLDYVATCRRL